MIYDIGIVLLLMNILFSVFYGVKKVDFDRRIEGLNQVSVE